MNVNGNQDGAPNYFPNSFSGPQVNKSFLSPSFEVTGDVDRHDNAKDDNYKQAGVWYKELSMKDRFNLADNIASHLVNAQEFLQKRATKQFCKVHKELGKMVKKQLKVHKKNVKEINDEPHLYAKHEM